MKTFDKKSMISLLLIFAILFSFIPSFISTSIAAQNSIFTDDFESYEVGTTVPSGGTAYTQIYNGTGDSNQVVISAEQKDGTTGNVLQLQGANGWSSQIKYSFTSDDNQYLIIEADVKPLSVNSPAGISLCSNSAGGYWTHSVCGIHMKNWGFYYGINDTGNPIDTDLTYTTGNWYRLSLVLDKTNHIFYNLLDGSLIGGRSFKADTATPEWIEFSSNNNGTNTAYFDNINLYSTDTFNFATVTFNSNGGSEVGAQTIIKGQKVEKPTAPTKSGLVFGGWYKEAGCINAWNFETDVVTETMTLYAKWDELITYPLWVGSTQVTNANQENVLGDGKVTFDPSTNTLDFDDAKITSSTQTTLEGSRAYAAILSKGIDLTITGKVKTSGGDVAVLSKKDNGIGGNLIFDGDIYAFLSVRAENDLIIKSGTVDAGMIVGYNSVTIKSDVSKVDSAGDIRGYTGITIEPPLEIQTGQTLKYNDEDNYYYIGHSPVSIYAPLVTTHNVKVSAININDYGELEGATLQVKDNTGKVIDEWVSTSASHEITGLNSNVEYTLEATVAADGYIIPSKTTFTIASDGTITSTGSTSSDGVLLVEFEMTLVEIKCIKKSDSSFLSGVTIQILDENGNIVEEWSSSTVNHKVLGLITQKEYTLRVTVVPDEELYDIPSDIIFTIDENGKITSTGTMDNGVVLVEVPVITPWVLTFKDIPEGSWYYDSVEYVAKRGLITGYNEDTFGPHDNLTREQLVNILWRIEGKPDASELPNNFTDIPEGKWYTDAVKWANANHIVNGYGGTTLFGRGDKIIRQDLAIMLTNYAKYKGKYVEPTGTLDKFADKQKVSNYAVDALRWASENSILSGNSNKDGTRTIDPRDNATRAQAAVMLTRFCQNILEL